MESRTKHPCAGMTRFQRAVFERIAINDPPAFQHVKALQALLDKGLIGRGPDRVLGRDRFGEIKVPDYFVPLPIHYQWCRWASEQPDVEEER